MELRKEVKIENNNSICGSSAFLDPIHSTYPLQQGVFDNIICEGGDESSLGFMELLGTSSMFDHVKLQATSTTINPLSTKIDSPNNQPATPNNSSSISSASSEALNEEPAVIKTSPDNDQEEQLQKAAKKELKPKKTNEKRRIREARFAFMTKSEVDHLEDGYRWRKYGQKAVKNSPFPRSYYRCTSASCNVKKRVERSFSDPTIVVTTYEGQHTHPSPVMPCPSFLGAAASDSGFSTIHHSFTQRRLSLHQQQQQQLAYGTCFSPNLGFGNYYHETPVSSNGGFVEHDQMIRYCTTTPRSALVEDHGLLQDVIPSHMLKEG